MVPATAGQPVSEDGLLGRWKPTENTFELSLREVLCDTAMLSVSKAERVHGIEFAMEIEDAGVREDFRVTVARLTSGDDASSCLDRLEPSTRISKIMAEQFIERKFSSLPCRHI